MNNNPEIFNVEPVSLNVPPNEKVCDNEVDVDIADYLIDLDDESKHRKRPRKLVTSSTNLCKKSSTSTAKSSYRSNQETKRPSTPKLVQQVMESSIFDLGFDESYGHRFITQKKQKIQGDKIDNLTSMKTDSFDLGVENIYMNLINPKTRKNMDNLNSYETKKVNPILKSMATECAIREDDKLEDSIEQYFSLPTSQGNTFSSKLSPQYSSSDSGKCYQDLISNVLSSMERSKTSRAVLRKFNLYPKEIRDIPK